VSVILYEPFESFDQMTFVAIELRSIYLINPLSQQTDIDEFLEILPFENIRIIAVWISRKIPLTGERS
jgi:hypothetical protein